jgi:hypothetical protein
MVAASGETMVEAADVPRATPIIKAMLLKQLLTLLNYGHMLRSVNNGGLQKEDDDVVTAYLFHIHQ